MFILYKRLFLFTYEDYLFLYYGLQSQFGAFSQNLITSIPRCRIVNFRKAIRSALSFLTFLLKIKNTAFTTMFDHYHFPKILGSENISSNALTKGSTSLKSSARWSKAMQRGRTFRMPISFLPVFDS